MIPVHVAEPELIGHGALNVIDPKLASTDPATRPSLLETTPFLMKR